MKYRELKNFWSITPVGYGYWELRKEFEKVLMSDTFDACLDYIRDDEKIWNAQIVLATRNGTIYPEDYYYEGGLK
jgi:hypothetical protein